MPVTWKDGRPNLPYNFNYAMSRLRGLRTCKRLHGAGKWQLYGEVFRKWKMKQYITCVEKGSGHFPVERKAALTTKLRPVFDSKDKTCEPASTERSCPARPSSRTSVLSCYGSGANPLPCAQLW